MKIRSLEKLQNLLDSDLAWRKKELIDLKLLIHTGDNPTFRRAGFALLSAHFEGFIKFAANMYVVYVSSQKLPLSELTNNFLPFYFSGDFKSLLSTNKVSVQTRFINKLMLGYSNEKFNIPYTVDNPTIKTEGNPTSLVLKEILLSVGLDYSAYETKNNYIDSDLLSNRHSIVHGEKAHISIEEWDTTLQNILIIINMINDQIMDAAISKKYLKPLTNI